MFFGNKALTYVWSRSWEASTVPATAGVWGMSLTRYFWLEFRL